ncbi:MAG TPA: hypothetical protein VFD14_02130, partial [Clostridia bacterium]|nr:hypothetical protein [Clostridia bacterium]
IGGEKNKGGSGGQDQGKRLQPGDSKRKGSKGNQSGGQQNDAIKRNQAFFLSCPLPFSTR